MIHTKSLIRRLAYVPWLLAFGLVAGWAGEAVAQQTVTLSGSASVRENAGATNVSVKATVPADAAADIYVNLNLASGTSADALNERFRITLPTLMIPKGKKEATGTIVFTPLAVENAKDVNDDFSLMIEGSAGTSTVTGSATITVIDVHKATDTISLSLSPTEISQEADASTITVTATVNGETVNTKSLSFPLIIVGEAAFQTKPEGDQATRDTDYTITGLGSITIPRKKVSGTATFTLDPKKGTRWIGIGTSEATDLRYDANSDTTAIKISTTSQGGKIDEFSTHEEQEIEVSPASLAITEKKVAEIKGDGFTASPASIREEVGETDIALKITLANVLSDDAAVDFSISAETGGAERDLNYTAEFGDLTIPAGATTGTATLTLTPIDDTGSNDARVITVQAKVGASTNAVDITITDDDTDSAEITLSVSPAEIREDADETTVTVTATLDGKVLEDDAKLTLVLGNMIATDSSGDGATATRDVDYEAVIRSVTIPAGEISGSTTVDITPEDDGVADGDETIILKSTNKPKNAVDDEITVNPAKITLKDTGASATPGEPDDSTPAFTEDDVAASDTAIEGTAGKALEDVVLPEASGDGELTYSVSANLPAGLAFDSATRTISGTPTMAGDTEVVYTVIDGDTGDQLPAESAALTYLFEIAETPEPTIEVAEVSVSQSSVRESGDTAEISVKATLAAAAPIAGKISFTIGAPSAGTAAVRDVDYTASLTGSVAVEEGATSATSTLILTPIDNGNEDGNRVVGVHAAGAGGSASADVTIADDETASTSISLATDPHTVGEGAGTTEVTITATLDGKVLDADATVTVSVDPASEATRDVDYRTLFNPLIEIPAGSVSGSVLMLLEPVSDPVDEGNETITLNGAIEGLVDGSATITLADVEMPPEDPLAFAEGTMIDAISTTASSPLDAVELPEASGGSGDIGYSVSELPAGLSFDPATRTISGTPEAAGTTEVTYTATDSEGATAELSFSIMVNEMLEFEQSDLGSLFGMFDGGAGKANPASEHGDDGVIPFIIGQAVNLPLPEVSGGTAPLTYSVSGLPAGLSFDPETRTISGAATELSDAVVVTYTVTDASGASSALPFLVAVIAPPLGAPSNLVAEDYKGADGQGDQGGFILLTWELSEHHDGIDGYRIFRALPVLGNEMVPWAMVDAVPGVERGVAVVATLDNVATNWGIAAERGGQTTHGAAKAVFVSGENQPYAQMAETLMASREAAQAGDAPVFASLLPEALAYAQGVAPRLNLVAGVLSSAMTVTEEPVRAIDDIAPLAVPSFNVLDAPNDEGSRIVLTWTLSPSDQLLHVVAEAVGPTAVEPVVGVHGYSIYRRAAGADEFAMIAQVDAGVASFVDETALNGVRYTYQVRPFDLDNETGSDIEQTAMAVRNTVVDSEGRAIFGLFGADNRIGFDDFFIFADLFGLTAEDAGFDPAFDLAPSAQIDFDDFFVFADNFGRSTAAVGKRVPLVAGLNADARMYLDARTAMPVVGEDFVLDVRVADFAALKGYGLQVQYEADKLAFVEVRTDQPLGGSALAAPQVLADAAGVLTVAAHGDVVSDGEVALSLVFRATTEIEDTIIEIADNQTYDSAFGFNRLALPAPVQLQTRPEVFALANNYPNPFNPATTIQYALPQASDVELTVYNVLGQPVRTLVAEHQSAGRYVVEWDATNDSGHSLSSGMYFYRLEAGGEFLEFKKMLLLK